MEYIKSLRRRLITATHERDDAWERCRPAEAESWDAEAQALNEIGCYAEEVSDLEEAIGRAESLGMPREEELEVDPPFCQLDRGALAELIHRVHDEPGKLSAALRSGRAELIMEVQFPAAVVDVRIASNDPGLSSGPIARWTSTKRWTRLTP